jgi:putative membrane protein insertion efficiency factor
MPDSLRRWPAYVLRMTIAFYRGALRPMLPTVCKHYPSCSHYAEQAIERHGVLSGLWLALRRVARCHPFSAGGYDPVPERMKTLG